MKKVFISYNHQDKEKARFLKKYLEKSGVTCWIDAVDLKIGYSLIQTIADVIDNTDFVIALISPNSVESEWVKKELSLALTKEILGKKIVLLPILIENCIIPNYLNDKLYADLSQENLFNSELKRILLSIDNTLNTSSWPDLQILYQNKNWSNILMIQTFADRPEWNEPSYHCVNPKRTLRKIIKVFGGFKHPIHEPQSSNMIESTIKNIIDLDPDIIGIGGRGRTAIKIREVLDEKNFKGKFGFWGGDVGIDACRFLKNNNAFGNY